MCGVILLWLSLCIFVIANDGQHLVRGFAFHVCSLVIRQLKFVYFLTVLLVFLLLILRIVCIFLYSGYKSPAGHVICKYSLPVFKVFFHSLKSVFWGLPW